MKIIGLVYQYNTRKYLVITSLIAVIGMILIFTQFFGYVSLADEKALDMLNYYNQSKFYEILGSLTESDRTAYKLIHFADYIFILGMYPFIAIILSRIIYEESKSKVVILIPIISGLFDILENIMMDTHLYLYPHEVIVFGSMSGFFSASKYILLYSSILILVLAKIVSSFQKRKHER